MVRVITRCEGWNSEIVGESGNNVNVHTLNLILPAHSPTATHCKPQTWKPWKTNDRPLDALR